LGALTNHLTTGRKNFLALATIQAATSDQFMKDAGLKLDSTFGVVENHSSFHQKSAAPADFYSTKAAWTQLTSFVQLCAQGDVNSS
jgi:hypothetical protein